MVECPVETLFVPSPGESAALLRNWNLEVRWVCVVGTEPVAAAKEGFFYNKKLS